jgi:hypothetical protein
VPDWERRAVAWLFDLCPPDYRGYDVLRRQPVALAHLAAATVAASAQAAEHALRTARHELRDVMTPEAIEAALHAFERERHRLDAAARAVDLVGRALRGERWAARL